MQESFAHGGYSTDDADALPFLEPADPVLERYQNFVYALASEAIYRNPDVRAIGAAAKGFFSEHPQLAEVERRRHEVGSLIHFLQGVNLHEEADEAYDAWQHTVDRPLSRAEAKKAFAEHPVSQRLLTLDQLALEQYQAALRLNPEMAVRVHKGEPRPDGTISEIWLTRDDVRILMLDLRTRMAERLDDPAERHAALERLDHELAVLIDEIFPIDKGKACELRVIRLMRRLISAADTGHLASVTHATPREDLRKDRGAFDVRVTALGRSFVLQIKAFNPRVGDVGRVRHYDLWQRARRKASETASTDVVYLDPLAVENAERRDRTQTGESLSLVDKEEALKPLLDTIADPQDLDFFKAIGLPKDRLKAENEALKRSELEFERESERLRAELAAKAGARIARERELEDIARAKAEESARLERLAVARAEAAAETARIEAAERAERRRLQAEALLAAERAAIAAREQRQREAQEAKEAAARRQAAVKKAVETRARKQSEKRTLKGVAWPRLLRALGFLPETWTVSDSRALLAAKEEFNRLFAAPGAKAVRPGEVDVNAFFTELFPDDESLAQPSEASLWRIREARQRSMSA